MILKQDNGVTNSGVGVSIYWRGIDEASVEEAYYFMFRDKLDAFTLPSKVCIEAVNLDVIKYLTETCKAKLVCLKNYRLTDKVSQNKRNNFHFRSAFLNNEDNDTLMYVVPEWEKRRYPILIKLSKDDKTFEFQAAGVDSEEVTTFCTDIQEKFGIKRNYDEELHFGVLFQQDGSISIKELPLDDNSVKGMNLALNYGSSFVKDHEKILSKFDTKRRGIFIFHGEAGTGKTTYIKYLAKHFGGKRMFIFIPTTHLESLLSPSLIPILLEHKDSVLVLEDAEKAVVSRENEHGNESLVSSLLNIGDGILGSILNISIILTFNTKKEKIDSALLRKGRLLYEYHFKPLNVSDANTLLKNLKKDVQVTEPTTLADLYNMHETTGHIEEEKRPIGFKQ
jgi:hypothetical protein